MAIQELEGREDWRRFNTFRSTTRPPGGELMAEAQLRMVNQLESIRQQHPEQSVAIVSHGDPIRAALTHFLGVPLDLALRLEIDPASVSVVQLADWGARVLCVNNTGEVPQ